MSARHVESRRHLYMPVADWTKLLARYIQPLQAECLRPVRLRVRVETFSDRLAVD